MVVCDVCIFTCKSKGKRLYLVCVNVFIKNFFDYIKKYFSMFYFYLKSNTNFAAFILRERGRPKVISMVIVGNKYERLEGFLQSIYIAYTYH